MKEIEKLKADLEYCYGDDEVYVLKESAIRNCEVYNSIDGTDRQKQHEVLENMLGNVGRTFGWEWDSIVTTLKTIHWQIMLLVPKQL